MKTILGKKIGMTQIFTEEGVMIPVTVIEARPNKVVQFKTKETDGYDAVQIGYMDLKENRANKPTKGHFEKWESPLKKHLAEVRLDEGEAYAAGQEITVMDFAEGVLLDVTGTSKGKGTQGNIKRHGHHRGPMSHGSKHRRLPGALAAGTYPSRVFKGNDGPGHMGHETITVQNLVLIKIIPERDIMLVKGAVPGARGGIVRIQYAVKAVQDGQIMEAKEPEPVEEPVVEEPVVEEPVVEEPVVEEPVIEEAAEEPAAEEPPAEEPDPEPPAAEEPPAEEPDPEPPAAEEPPAEEPPAEEPDSEPPTEEPPAEEPPAEEPDSEPPAEEPATDEAAEETPAEEAE